MNQSRFIVALISLFLLSGAFASDLTREGRITEQIEEAILDGEPVWIEAEGRSFLGIHTEAEPRLRKGAVILLHGMGANPDWTEVIQPLRTSLPEHGWETLSIQVPVAATGAPIQDWEDIIPEAGPRIVAAVNFLKQRGQFNIILIGHSLGAHMGAYYLANPDPAPEIRALVSIGISSGIAENSRKTLDVLKKIKLPILDIYGERDFPNVRSSARAKRLAAGATDNQAYRQLEVPGADHFFRGLESELTAHIRSWLNKTASGQQLKAKEPDVIPGPVRTNQ